MGVITETDAGEAAAPPRRRFARRVRLDPVLALCGLALVAFPVVCTLAASRAPVDPRPAERTVGAVVQGPRVRYVPVFDPRGAYAGLGGRPLLNDPAAVRALVEPAIDRLFARADAARLRRYLNARQALPAPAGVAWYAYPYRYRGLDPLLDGALRGRPEEAELGALLVVAAAAEAYPNAGQVAWAILHRARARGACGPQLNLAYLVAATADPGDHERELAAAERACPGDPTATWLAGQLQSIGGSDTDAVATFRALQRRQPRSAAGWSGEADVQLRMAYADDGVDTPYSQASAGERDDRPFTARSRYRRALALYRRSRALDRDPGLAAGEARALAGLGEYASAARLAGGAARALGRPAVLQARLVDALERAGSFAAAATEARRLAHGPRFPQEPALFFLSRRDDEYLIARDALEPLSLGAGRLTGDAPAIAPRHEVGIASPIAVGTLEFLPLYRPDELSRFEPWCADWSARRDLILAGRPREAIAGLPAAFTAANDSDDCGQTDAPMLAAVALAEAGDRRGAVARLRRDAGMNGAEALKALAERRQNLWRFAGRYDRAAAVAAEHAARFPTSVRAFERAGEIDYLRGRYDDAARDFGKAARLARARSATWSDSEAGNLLKRGVVLRFAGRYEDAVQTLLAADEVASRARSPQTAYLARAQAGDTYLRLRRYGDADEQYDAAREAAEQDGGTVAPAVENNQAVARLRLGHAAAAVEPARAAVRSDPRNPLFLETLGSAYAHAGDPRRAAAADWRAVRADPTLFQAWNDLGVSLARLGRDHAAVSALRRAVGVRRTYALAWFNLGVTLEDAGPRHAATAQGAFGRAARLDGALADREHRLILDDRVYFARLDLSKPLPPKWQFADSQPQWPVPAAGLALALLFALQFGRAAAARGLPGGTQRWLELARDFLGRLPRLLVGFGPAAVAVAATVAVFVWPAVRGHDRGLAGLGPLVVGVLMVVAMIARARVLAARRAGVSLRQRSWRPALLVALAGAALGIPWAPLPVADTGEPAPAVHWSGPLVAGGIGLVLVVLGVALHVPATQAVGAAAVVMAASLLTPVAPLDGGRIGGATPLAIGFGLVGVAILALLGLD